MPMTACFIRLSLGQKGRGILSQLPAPRHVILALLPDARHPRALLALLSTKIRTSTDALLVL